MYYIAFYCEFKNVTYESIKTNIKNHSLVSCYTYNTDNAVTKKRYYIVIYITDIV